MILSVRPSIYTLPSYSLTSDLLNFLRCGLQYRYTRLGKLPAARPVQMWFGQFIHGVLEESYLRYDLARKRGDEVSFPWSQVVIDEVCNLIKRRLAAQGLFPWSEDLEKMGDKRAEVAINLLGPELFPLIHRAEVRLTGARILPNDMIPLEYRFRDADRYEMVGIIDVITHVEINDPELQENRLVQVILKELPSDPPERFEIIIDYKGMRRPPLEVMNDSDAPSLWDIYGWQVQTYAHIRSTHIDSLPIVAGVIIYLNELLPTIGDLESLRKEEINGTTDIPPAEDLDIPELLRKWRGEDVVPDIPLDLRFRRALRVVPISQESVQQALLQFDEVVARIEICRGKELKDGRIIRTWEKNPADEDTCVRCDSRTFCPSYTIETKPRLPGVRIR